MKFLIIPMLLGVIAYTARLFYVLFLSHAALDKRKNIVLSFFGAVLLFALCLFLGGWILGFGAHLLLVFLMADLILLLFKLPFLKKYNPQSFKNFKRIFTAFVVAISVAMTIWGSYNAKNIRITKYTVSFDGKSYDHTKILFISDIHANDSNTTRICNRFLETCKAEKPQIVIIGGDLADNSTKEQNLHQIACAFGSVTNEIPVLFVCGNHDIMGGDGFGTSEVVQILQESGIKVLRDEVYEFGGISFVGRNEIFDNANRKSVEAMVPNIKEKATVVIDHQPKELKELGTLGADLTLSGHTHNGQIFPIGHLCSLFGVNELQYGKKVYGSNTAIVSSGAGTWGMDVRTQGISEFVIVEIE